MGREGSSRGTTQISRAHRLRFAGHFVLTNISLSNNVEKTARTICGANGILRYVHTNGSRGNFDWFRTNATFSTRSGCISLAASTSLLSSVIALYWGRLLRLLSAKTGRCQGLESPAS